MFELMGFDAQYLFTKGGDQKRRQGTSPSKKRKNVWKNDEFIKLYYIQNFQKLK